MKPRSFSTYSWHQIGRADCAVTSFNGHTDTVDWMNGMLRSAATRAACTSPRRAYMPVRPTGASAIGRSCFTPNHSVLRSSVSEPFSTRWRKATSCKSSTLARSVDSVPEPPSR
jgi:hypothetical protein